MAHSTDIPVREQIATQILLAISSGELAPGMRLPSTREMARRFRVHANTVSAAYRQLEQQGRLQSRRGSGVYVREVQPSAESAADQLLASFLHEVRQLGVSANDIGKRLQEWLAVEPPDHFLMVETDAELREILMEELREVLTLPVRGIAVADLAAKTSVQAAVLVLPSNAAAARTVLGQGREIIVLQVTSVPHQLLPWLPLPSGILVGLCSCSIKFLKMTCAVLIGAGLDPMALVTRHARGKEWERGLEEVAAVVCDVVVATRLPPGLRVIPIRILARASLAELLALDLRPRTRPDRPLSYGPV